MLLKSSCFVRTLSLVDAEVSRLILWSCSAATSETSIYKDDDEETEDAVTSNVGMTLVILSLLCQPL